MNGVEIFVDLLTSHTVFAAEAGLVPGRGDKDGVGERGAPRWHGGKFNPPRARTATGRLRGPLV